jgi:hypothetical protein
MKLGTAKNIKLLVAKIHMKKATAARRTHTPIPKIIPVRMRC